MDNHLSKYVSVHCSEPAHRCYPEPSPGRPLKGTRVLSNGSGMQWRQMNAYNGSDDYNARKPWRINRYGVLEGNPKFGPTSAYAPNNWTKYNGNRYWYMWDYWHAPSGVWGKPDLNAAGVPHIRPYIQDCLRKAGVGLGGPNSRQRMPAVINMQEQQLLKTRKISGDDVVIQVPDGVTIIRATMIGV